MKLFIFYLEITVPLLLLVFFGKTIGPIWFGIGITLYAFYNTYLGYYKLKKKGYHVGLFTHLNPFSKKSQKLYQKVYFEP
jgi:hypothetical protein